MQDKRPIYIIDTNVLIDYVDIIPSQDGETTAPKDATIDLSNAHIVIPTVVISECSKFKKENSERGKASRALLGRIRAIVEKGLYTMEETYRLGATFEMVAGGGQILSILPVHKNFKNSLPFEPSDDDMDGQIILSALTAMAIENDLAIDGSAPQSEMMSLKSDSVVLLTNDNGLITRANARGVRTERYGHKYPEPYTGRRDIFVPKDLLLEFFATKQVSREMFETFCPEQRKLVANEFVVMELEDPADYPRDFNPASTPYFEHIGRYDAELDALVRLDHLGQFPITPRNPGQAIYAEALANPKISAVICTGPAGSGKTYMSTIWGYIASKEDYYIGVTVVPCETHGNLGALPGELEDKMDPRVQPLKNAIRNFLLFNDKEFKRLIGAHGKDKESGTTKPLKAKLYDRVELIWSNWFTSVPIEHARGRDFAYELAIYDEFQDQNATQADTLIKRIGKQGKIVLTGDIRQIHANYLDRTNNGLAYASQLLYDHPMVAQVCFTEKEVIRHPLVQKIAERQEEDARRHLTPNAQ